MTVIDPDCLPTVSVDDLLLALARVANTDPRYAAPEQLDENRRLADRLVNSRVTPTAVQRDRADESDGERFITEIVRLRDEVEAALTTLYGIGAIGATTTRAEEIAAKVLTMAIRRLESIDIVPL